MKTTTSWGCERLNVGGAEVIVVVKTTFAATGFASWFHIAGNKDVEAVLVGEAGRWRLTIVDERLAEHADPWAELTANVPSLRDMVRPANAMISV